MFEKVEKLFKVVTGNAKAELGLLNNACIDRMNAYQKSPTRTLKQDWDAAKEGLKECIDRLWPLHFPEEAAAAAEPQLFARQKDALGWLHGKGYKCSGGKFSNDWNNGKLTLQRDGSIRLQDLLVYAATLGIDQKRADSASQRQAKKDDLDIRLKEEQLKKIEHENRKEDARWILKDDATDQAACLIVLLKNTLNHHCSQETPAVILACGGGAARALEVEAHLQGLVATSFNELAASREARLVGLVDGAVEEDD